MPQAHFAAKYQTLSCSLILLAVTMEARRSAPEASALKKAIMKKKEEEEMDKCRLQQEELDNKADQPSDEVGDAALLAEKVLNSGKLKGKTFREAYLENKGYLSWMRDNVKAESNKFSSTMLQFRLYIEERDAAKISRVMIDASRAPYRAMGMEKVNERLHQHIRRGHQEMEWTEVMAGEAAIPEPEKEQGKFTVEGLAAQLYQLDLTITKALEQRALLQHEMENLTKDKPQ